MADINNILKDHTVDIYDGDITVAEAITAFSPRKVRIFTREYRDDLEVKDVTVFEYLSAGAVGLTSADVCMLDRSALKALAVRYPSDSQYLLARLAPRSAWVLGLLGMIRRLFLGRIKLGGIVKIGGTYWLLINRTSKTVKNKRLLFPKKVGATAFFAWLKKEEVNYVVPRFYENLPELHRDDGDLDLLVADEDVQKTLDYIHSQSGELTGTSADSIPIGMHSVSLGQGVPYYPPPIARAILDRAIDGPAGSRIPDPKDALHALIYHVLYHHKGYSTGVPTTLEGKAEHPPENDYYGIIKKQAAALGIEVGETMEDFDEYMAEVGWRPKRDTLNKIAQRNPWVRDRFFADHDCGATGLTVFMLKEKAFEKNLVDDVVSHMKENGLKIVRVMTLDEQQKKLAADEVRGGNWVDMQGSTKGLLPAGMVIAVDPQCAHLPPAYAGDYERVWSKRRKQQLRDDFDTVGEASLVHAADNTQEAWEYVEICFPDEVEDIRNEVEEASHAPLRVRLQRKLSPTYITNTVRFWLRDFVTKKLL